MSLSLAACASTSHKISPAPATDAVPEPAPGIGSSATQLMVDTATSMIGQPYRFGGSAPGGFDCSGLVVYSAANAGIRVPRTAAEQLEFGQPVARTELQPGDLLFMHLSSKELHVAIALDRQLFVHAPSSGGRVRVDSLLAPPYAKGFIAARRVVSSTSPH
ncbi:MAG TPA: C40 family peptidase [Steroidobacteraceae bacterium]|nr:C40 family peptidase [Steroidobacteraceae bacterium]